jgi:hypothetical protein
MKMKLTCCFDSIWYFFEPFTLYKDHYMFIISYLNKTKLYRFFFTTYI